MQSLTAERLAKTLKRMRFFVACLALCLTGSPVRAQAPALPTAPPPPTGASAAPPPASAGAPAAAAAKPVAAQPVAAKLKLKKKKRTPPPPPPPAAELFALNTHESFLLRPDRKGRITR